MKTINLTKEQMLFLLLNPNPFDQGVYGILSEVGEYLFKVNYKDFIETYISNNPDALDGEVDIWLKVEKESNMGLRNVEKQRDKFKRLESTKSSNLIVGVLSYRDLYVGTVLHNFKGYVTLAKADESISIEERNIYISKAYELANDLLAHDIVPKDLSENNVLVNLETGDVVLIDLDDGETTYGPEGYVDKYPHHRKTIESNVQDMIRRLNNRRGIKDPREL